MIQNTLEIISFSNKTSADKKLLKQFVNFHWRHYADEPRFIPLLDYEFLGHKLLGITGWLQKEHLFFRHGEMQFFMAMQNGEILGRVCALINHDFNNFHNDKTGFFSFFEAVDRRDVSDALLNSAGEFLKARGMTAMRGPQNLPFNEATPGTLVDGFDAMPVVYYHYNFPYYADLLRGAGMRVVKKVVGFDIPVQPPLEKRITRIAEFARKKYSVEILPFNRKNYKEFRGYMLDIYNEAWQDNWGFVPFKKDEFFANLDDMRMIWDPNMFLFAFVKGEPAAFWGAVPNIFEKMKPLPVFRRFELLRAAKMFISKSRIRSFRQGYFGIRPQFRKIGLDAMMIVETKKYIDQKKYQACDLGWVLEDNEMVLRGAEYMNGKQSRAYEVFEKNL